MLSSICRKISSGSTRPDYNQILSERNMVPDYTLVKRSGDDQIDTNTQRNLTGMR